MRKPTRRASARTEAEVVATSGFRIPLRFPIPIPLRFPIRLRF
jgi:hypothetical protein